MSPSVRLSLAASTVALAAGLAAPGAQAAFFPAESIDGPTPDIVRLGDVDVAREGGSALVYLKRAGGVQHVFVARMTNGAWGGGEQVDVGQGAPSVDPQVAVADGGRVVATWINDNKLWGAVRESVDSPWTPPTLIHAGAAVERHSLDMSLHRVGYVAFTAGGDVRAARLSGTTWTAIDPQLDNDPGRPAGGGAGPDVVAAADGTGLAAWEELGADGRTRVFARRIVRTRVSSVVRELSVPDFEGRPGGNAIAPDAGMDDDSSFGWVAFSQVFDDGGVQRRRAIARRLVGSDYDPPVALDGLTFPAAEDAQPPRLDVNGRRRGFATTERSPGAATVGAVLEADVFGAGSQIDTAPSASASQPVPARSSNGTGVFAWYEDPGGGATGSMVGRFFNVDDELEPPTPLSNGEFGPSVPDLGVDAAADRVSDVAVAFVQGGAADRRIVVAHYDRPLREITLPSALTRWQRSRRPRIAWSAAVEFWGAARYRVDLNGFPIGITTSTRLALTSDLPEGSHTVRIVSIDRRGQESVGPDRNLNVDATKPAGKIRTKGSLRAGRVIRFIAKAVDNPPPPPPPPPGTAAPSPIRTSGVTTISVTFGDRTRARTSLRGLRHVYRRRGNYKVRLVVTDRAGNKSVTKLTVRVR